MNNMYIISIVTLHPNKYYSNSFFHFFFSSHAGDTPAPNDALATVVIGF